MGKGNTLKTIKILKAIYIKTIDEKFDKGGVKKRKVKHIG